MSFFAQETVENAVVHADAAERKTFVFRVYSLLATSLVAAVAGGYVGPYVLTPGLQMGAFILQFVMIFVVFAVQRVRYWNIAALLGFTTLSGLTLGPALQGYDSQVVQNALLLTAVIFIALSGYVITSKRDFSFLGGFLFVGLILVLVGSVLQIFFFRSPMSEFVISSAGVLLFSGYILYDTSNIMRRYATTDYTSATLALYLDILNLFLFLLRLLGRER